VQYVVIVKIHFSKEFFINGEIVQQTWGSQASNQTYDSLPILSLSYY